MEPAEAGYLEVASSTETTPQPPVSPGAELTGFPETPPDSPVPSPEPTPLKADISPTKQPMLTAMASPAAIAKVKAKPAPTFAIWFWRVAFILLTVLFVFLIVWWSLVEEPVPENYGGESAASATSALNTSTRFCATPPDFLLATGSPVRATTRSPTVSPTMGPSGSPTVAPTFSPTHSPSVSPSLSPSTTPTISPSLSPTLTPTSSIPTLVPSTTGPTLLDGTFSPTLLPTAMPTTAPTTASPTASPSAAPTLTPTGAPSLQPTTVPSAAPWSSPTKSPTASPISCTAHPAAHVGDGWCDDFSPFNTKACAWDGGDCCNIIRAPHRCRDPEHENFGMGSPRGQFPAPRNPRYDITEREETTQRVATTYNNYYEISWNKLFNTSDVDWFFGDPDWSIEITGLVSRPMNIRVVDLISMMQLEERYYRHRCVEAWSIAVPWVGFPLSKLLDLVRPTSGARYVKFTSYLNTTLTPNQLNAYYPWPYTESLTMEEAYNELPFMSVGLYQTPIGASSGGPIRMTIPWKYGFKSIKSIRSIELLAERPDTFWPTVNSAEYGFWANVNPDVPHPRWSQASERLITDDAFTQNRQRTQLFNGYEAEVSYLYENIDPSENLYR